MQLVLTRKWLNGDALIGELYVDGEYECVILERASVRVPLGTYKVSITYSPRFGRPLPILMNVPSREGIRLHSANYPHELEGCLAPGMTHNSDSVSNSQFACRILQEKIQAALPNVSITICEAFTS